MFRLLPWSSALGGFNINHKMLATPPSCTSTNTISLDPTTALALPKSQLKRKRSPSTSTDTAIAQDAPAATRFRPDQPTTQINLASFSSNKENANNTDKHIPVAPPSPLSQATIPPSPSTPVASRPKAIDTDKLRETLEAQLSLEVLLKHNELRLIDQEIAKSQIALEQLRRCSEIPYPGSQVAGVSTSLSNGTGMAVCPPGNGPVPLSPAPWGVTDGPYSRHYAKWLLPDPRFDGGHLEDASSPWSAAPMPGMAASAGFPNVEGRSTRCNPGDSGALASNTRPQRGSAGSKLQALPNGYAAPKERAGPMIIRRKSDGVFVKLVCLDCRRDNFSSTQGFINHCRIAHNRNFASHDAAAVASGEPVELDEAGAVAGGSKTETSSGPPAPPGYVHPLVRSAHVIEPSQTPAATATTPRQRSSSTVETPRNPTHKRNPSETINSTSSFLASPATPHLSSLMKHQGAGVDLGQLVGEAKATVDLEAYSSADEDDGPEDDSAPPATDANAGTEIRTSRQPMRTVGSPATAPQQTRVGRKPPSLESLTPVRPGTSYISPYGPTPTTDEHVDGMDLSANLSPNTVESNQAPSLVSDDDDDDDDDGEAVSECGSPGPTSSVDGDDADQEFSHIDVEDDDDDATTSAAATAEPKNGPPGLASPAPTTTSLSNSLRRSNHHAQTKKDRFIASSTPVPALEDGQEEKHVSFVSPEMSPDTSPSKGKKGDDGK